MNIKNQYGAGLRTGILIGAGTCSLLLLGLVALASADRSSAAFVEIGKSNFIRPAEYIWWQGAYPHEFRTDSNYFRVGFEKDWWRISGFDLGHYSTRALATSDEALLADGRCNAHTCAPPDSYETRGSVRGLLFSAIYRKWSWFLEGGASITRQKFWLHVNVLDDRSGNGPAGRFYNWADTNTAIGYMAAIGFEHKGFTFSAGYWLNGKASEFYAAGNTPGIDTVKTFAVGYNKRF